MPFMNLQPTRPRKLHGNYTRFTRLRCGHSEPCRYGDHMPLKRKESQPAAEGNPSSATRATKEKPVAAFSPLCAFVVQFRSGRKSLEGRAEHIASGDAIFFEDHHELLQFFSRILKTTRKRCDRHCTQKSQRQSFGTSRCRGAARHEAQHFGVAHQSPGSQLDCDDMLEQNWPAGERPPIRGCR